MCVPMYMLTLKHYQPIQHHTQTAGALLADTHLCTNAAAESCNLGSSCSGEQQPFATCQQRDADTLPRAVSCMSVCIPLVCRQPKWVEQYYELEL